MSKAKLRYVNNWELDEYYVGTDRVETISKVEINGVEYKVTSRPVSVRYMDHGHEGYSKSIHYFVSETVFGIKMEFDLNRIVQKKPVYLITGRMV